MSVTTDADRKLDLIGAHVKAAYKAALAFSDMDLVGAEQYGADFRASLLTKLLHLSDMLKNDGGNLDVGDADLDACQRWAMEERLALVRRHVVAAYKALMEFLDPDLWGSDEYKVEFKEKMVEKLTLLHGLVNR